MDNIIVTIVNDAKSINCDVRLPSNQMPGEFIENLANTINQYYGRQVITNNRIYFVSRKTNKPLSPKATLKESGVINGDYIELMEI